jgi:hypothetical protein
MLVRRQRGAHAKSTSHESCGRNQNVSTAYLIHLIDAHARSFVGDTFTAIAGFFKNVIDQVRLQCRTC